MKIFSQRIATFVACTSVAYLSSTPFVLGHRAGDAVEINAADPIGQHTFNALNHDDSKTHHHHHNVDHHHGHHHHGHHHLKHHKKPHHKKPHHDKHLIAKKVHLVCDGKIIDTLKCPIKVCDAIAVDVEAVDSASVDASSNTFHAKNNGGTDPIPQVFIKMDLPCSKEPPKGCTADVPMANQDATGATEESDPTETTDDSEETELDEAESEDSDAIDLAKRDDVADTDFEASNHGGGHKHRHHHHSKHHRHGKHHNHDKHHHHHKHGHHDKKHRHKNKHPWKDFCVAVGDFCGSSLYGCDFSHKTLYRCSAIGERPIVVKVDAEECGGPPPVKKCPCPADFVHAVCGSELPEECNADPTQIYHCPEGPLSEFEVLKKCPPGTVCVPGKDGNDATCGYESCECSGDKEYCSSQFPARCGLKKNTIYKCVGGKLTEVKSCDDTAQECVAVGDGAICGSCKCPSDGEICGDTFPLKCRLSATGLYKCKKGETPELVKECLPGYCSAASHSSIVFESEIDKDVCIDGCTCVREGDFCGRSFSPECGLDVNTLYKCSGPGVKPEVKEKCENGCIVKAGANVCNKKNDCICPSTDPICGGDLPASCKADSNTIYVCRDGNGGTPEPIEICPPGKQCQKKPSPEGAVCGSDNCECTGTGEICSDTFPDKCGLQKNTIYKCTAGKPEKVKTCEGDKSCVSVSDGAVCVNCKCLDDGTVCGKIFPRHCNLKATALYTCKKGEDPVLQKDCYPNTCSPSKGAVFEAAGTNMDSCIDKCVCVGTGQVCGSTFHPDCKLRGSTLYKCEGKGTTPIELEKCKDGECIVSNGDNKCANENKCTCPAGFDAVCGSELPVECQAAIKVESGAVYYCPEGPGSLPQVKKICPPGHICQPKPAPEGATCGGSTCDCKGKHEVCSDTFPEDCKLEKNTIYKCSETGTPTKVKTCEDGTQCITVADGAVCVRDDCKCTKDGEVCGAVFPSTCNLKHTAIYTCKRGEPPVLKTDCFPERCTASKSSMTEADATFQETHDVCSDSCVCEREGTMCGSSFQKKCQLASGSLYQCTGKGTKPTLLKECKDGRCIVKLGDDECAVDRDPCLCRDGKDHCGFTFPAKCHLDKEIVYKCPGGKGTKPVPGDKCKDGECTETVDGAQCKDPCKCQDKKDVCGSTFPTECKLDADTVYQCSGKDVDPVPGNKCKPGECMTGDPNDACKPPPPVDCNCRDGDDICGSQYDDSCKFDKDALYKCPGGKGTKPVPGDKCKTGVCQVNPTGPDKCEDDPCKCKEKKDVCGHTFPTECKLDADTVYQCSGKGVDPVPGDKCKTGECTETSYGAQCKEDPCTCQDKVDVCGSTFPTECKLDADTAYQCSGKGVDPVPGDKCKAGECIDSASGAKCKEDPCKCQAKKDVCGSTFPTECKLDADTVYQCSGKGVDPVPGDKCKTGECIDSASGAKCKEDPCKCQDKVDVCGSTFPTECKLDADTVYQCSGKGVDPVPGDKCKAGECIDSASGAKCKDDPCKCKGGTKVCGSMFDDSCNLEKTALFSCNGTGTTPTKVSNCTLGCELTSPDNKCKDCGPQVKNATTALDSVGQLLEKAIQTGGSTAVVAAVLAKNIEKLKLDLPLAAADAIGLGAIAGPGKHLVGAASDLLDKLANGTADAATTALIDALRALVPTLGAVEECAGGNTTDCKSIIQLYKDIKTTAFDLLKGIPGVSTIIGPIISQLQNATDTIDTALESGSGALVGDAIGAIDVVIGTISTNPLLKTALAPVTALFEAAKAAIKCQLGIEIDKCALINKRFEGALAALIDIVKDNLDKIPIFGKYISTPVLDALKEAVIDIQKGGAGAIGTAAGTLRGLLQIINLAGGGNDLSNPITNAILSILGIVDGAGECATGGDPCSGVIKIAKALISSAATAIGDLIPGAGFLVKQAINAFLNPLASALNTVSATAINTAVAALKIPGAALKALVPSIGPAVDTLIGGLEMVAKCLTTGGQTNVPLMAAPTMAPTV